MFAKAINIAMTWAGCAPVIAAGLENGTNEGRRVARQEMANMADAADVVPTLLEALMVARDVLQAAPHTVDDMERGLAVEQANAAIAAVVLVAQRQRRS